MTLEPKDSSMQGSEVRRAGAYSKSIGGNTVGVEALSNNINKLL
jgi:hypothetical protein